MPPCSIQIELDKPSAIYETTGLVTGRLAVSVFETTRFRQVTLRLLWKAKGRGTLHSKTGAETVILPAGTWAPGQELSLPFELRAPSGPVTYHGWTVKLDWFLEARVEVPLGSDITDSVPVILVGSRSESEHDPEALCRRSKPPHGRSYWFVQGRHLLGGLLAITLGGALLLAAHGKEQGAGLEWTMGGLLVLVGVGLLSYALKNLVSQRAIGAPDVHIEPMEAPGGTLIQVQMVVRPRRELELLGAKVRLLGRELARHTVDTHVQVKPSTIHDSVHEPTDKPRFLVTGQPTTLVWEIPLPEKAPPSLAIPDNWVRWHLEVSLELAGWIDWSQKFPITVLPTPGCVHSLAAFMAPDT